MRNLRIAAVVSAVGVALATALAAPTGAGAHEGGRGDVQRVRVTDDCDPVSFNAALGDQEACLAPGDTTFADFLAQLVDEGEADDWEFDPDEFHLDSDEAIKAVNTGGEFHTFTEVREFGGGCVDELNMILGLSPVAECDDPLVFGTTGLPSGGSLRVPSAGDPPLAPGKHRFECLIHPWMQTTVTVRR